MADGETVPSSGLLSTTRLRVAADRWADVPGYLFDGPAWPRCEGRADAGRGGAWYVGDETGDYVLRHFRRGGMAARLSRRHYVATGAASSRAFREFDVLARLRAAGLPVPLPVAAAYWRRGVFYRAALVIERIPEVTTLAARLAAAPLSRGDWRDLGALVARLHAAGACHADLNAHNVLIDAAGGFHLIDFDRARMRAPGRWQRANLARLRRSLDKLAAEGPLHFREADWQAFESAYAASSSASAA